MKMNDRWSFRPNKIVFQYKRDLTGHVFDCISRVNGLGLSDCQECISQSLAIPAQRSWSFEHGLLCSKIVLVPSEEGKGYDAPLLIFEFQYETHTSGIIFLYEQELVKFKTSMEQTLNSLPDRSFCALEWLAFVLLSQPFPTDAPRNSERCLPDIGNSLTRILESLNDRFVQQVCELFEHRILYQNREDDKWHAINGGRAAFAHRVSYFVNQSRPIFFCLPAFPCKSPNFEKAFSALPDGGEYEALTTLHQFCREVRQIYNPGCSFEIVSDGHVFSDCIGVDDDMVIQYTNRLVEMSARVHQDLCSKLGLGETIHDSIRFVNLQTILFPSYETAKHFDNGFAASAINFPIETRRIAINNLCRRLLLKFSDTSNEDLHQTIRSSPDTTLTQLYRGFSRFMLDDLIAQAELRSLSRTQRKRKAAGIALEMIQRNQCYSNLIETAMPRHIRLSIHAHDNSGAKIAIRLLPSPKFQVLQNFGLIGFQKPIHVSNDSKQHLHIPTPWHNVLVDIEGHISTYVCKAAVVRNELLRPDSPWSSTSGYIENHPRGGRYILKPKLKAELDGSG